MLPNMMLRLKDKIALITGAGAGIGEESCYRFAREGAVIVALDLRENEAQRVADAVRSEGGTAHALAGDVSVQESCKKAVEWTRNTLGRIDVLFNVAGIVHGGTLVDATEDDWEIAMDVNVKGMFHMCRLTVPIMLDQDGGSIINVASVAGPFGVKDRGVYSVSKAAVIGLTKSLAMDFVSRGIRVNAICPGTVETPSWHERVRQSPHPDETLKMMIARQPMGRVGRPEEIAALAAYLASDESSYITGQAIYIDGGMTM